MIVAVSITKTRKSATFSVKYCVAVLLKYILDGHLLDSCPQEISTLQKYIVASGWDSFTTQSPKMNPDTGELILWGQTR